MFNQTSSCELGTLPSDCLVQQATGIVGESMTCRAYAVIITHQIKLNQPPFTQYVPMILGSLKGVYTIFIVERRIIQINFSDFLYFEVGLFSCFSTSNGIEFWGLARFVSILYNLKTNAIFSTKFFFLIQHFVSNISHPIPHYVSRSSHTSVGWRQCHMTCYSQTVSRRPTELSSGFCLYHFWLQNQMQNQFF